MIKTTFLAFTALLLFNSVNAQVLYNETFDNYTVGNLGTDPTGVTPGQGGWLTGMAQNANNSHVTIATEPNKGKVLSVSSGIPPQQHNIAVVKTGLNTFVDQRTAGYNVIKLEVDFYTGAQHSFNNAGMYHRITLANSVDNLIQYTYSPADNGRIGVSCKDQTKLLYLNNNPNNPPSLPFNTWVTFITYLDYNNKKVYFETPYFNTVAVGDFLSNSTSTNLIQDFKPSTFSYLFSSSNLTSTNEMVNKVDNVKITALKSVPPSVLSASSFLSESFNLYPNPATNIVNITNSDNMFVNQVEIYDLSGKLINAQNFNNEAEIHLNVENLASGTYLLHLQTDQGIAVKKLIKK